MIYNSTLAFLLGSIVGLSELLSRYSDPKKIFDGNLGKFYIILNGLISVLGFWTLKNFQGSLEIRGLEIKNILISGLGAMVILRSSIANINVNGKKVEVGIGAILQIFLDTIEKLFNRKISEDTLAEITTIMDGVDFELAKINLPSICLNTFQNFSEEQTKQLGSKIKTLSDSGFYHLKSIELGIILEKYFGKDFLAAAVKILKEQISRGNGGDSLNDLIETFR